MTKQAIIVGGQIAEFPDFPVHPDAVTEVPGEAEIGWLVSGSGVVAPDAISTWYVDAAGDKHAEDADGRQALSCVYADRLVLDAGTWRAATDGEALAALKASLKGSIDADAETERWKYITPGSGQAMTYQAKLDEARALQADGDPDAADYPLLSAEVDITAADMAGVAGVVLASYAAWQQIGAAIEAARLGAKMLIDEAGDEAAARAVTAVWPAP